MTKEKNLAANSNPEEIMQITQGKELRTQSDVSTGLSIACYINVRTPHTQHLQWYYGKEHKLFVLSEIENPKLGELIKHWRIGTLASNTGRREERKEKEETQKKRHRGNKISPQKKVTRRCHSRATLLGIIFFSSFRFRRERQ